MKKITIDASSILPGRKMDGVGRTTLGLVEQLASMELPFEVSLFTQRLRGERLTRYSFKKCHLPLPRWKPASFLTSRFPIIESLCRSDLYHIPHNYAPYCKLERVIVTIHDVMFFSFPEEHLGTAVLKEKMPTFVQQCRAIITISESSKNDIVNYLGVDADKVFVIPWGIDHTFLKPIDDLTLTKKRIAAKFFMDKPYFFSVSCDIGRKNTPKLVEEYLKFAENKPKNDLMLVWRNPPKEVREMIEHSPYGKRVHIVSSVSDEELRDLYRASTALVFPSLYEGFGLPVLEAMACGTAVVTTPLSSLPEVGGDAAYYIDPNEENAIRDALIAFENNEINREEMIHKGLSHAKKFTWEECARKTIDVYMKVLDIP